MLFDNMLAAFLEAFDFLTWLLPRLFKNVIVPIFGLCLLGFLAVTKGWDHVSKILTEKWVDKGLENHWFTYKNQETATKILRVGSHLEILLGIFLIVFIVVFTVWFGYQMMYGSPLFWLEYLIPEP